MIYILTGIAKSGKSLISKKIVDTYLIPLISTDDIMMNLHRTSTIPDLDIHASDRSVAYKLEPFILKLITEYIENRKDLLIEGVHFNTSFSKKLLSRYPKDIKIIYMGYKDVTVEDKTNELYQFQNQIDNPWIFDHQGQSVQEIVSYMIKESNRIYEECFKEELLYIEVYNVNAQMPEIIKKLMNS